jgi:choice-of-anchor C domain-containing protein
MKKLLIAGLASVGLMLGVYGTAEANLITNGSFEGNVDIGSFMTLSAGSNLIPGWTVSSGSIDWIGSYWTASDGTKSIDLAGYFAQGLIVGTTFDTVAGQTYRVQFDMAGNPYQSYDKALVAATVGGITQSFTFDQAGHSYQTMGWETKYFDFIAGGSSAQLSFGDATGNADQAWGAALDNVRVDAVPEPSTLLLLGAGFAGFGIFGRKFRRSTQK